MASVTQPGRIARDLLHLAATGIGDLDICWEAARRVRRLVPFEAWCWIPVDPATLLPSGAHAGDNPAFRERGKVPRLLAIEFDEGRDFNLHAALARRRQPAGILSAATEGDLGRSRRWRELLGPSGLGDELRVALVANGACWGCLSLYRERSSRRFSDAEAACLGALAAPFGEAMRAVLLAEPPRHEAAAGGPGVLLINPETGRWSASQAVRHWLRNLSRPDGERAASGPRPALPAPVHALAARVAALERDGTDRHPPPRLRARTIDGTWLTLQASRLLGPNGSNDIAITFERAQPAAMMPLVLRAYAVTRREAELIAHVLRGATTDAIARALGISANTVQDHLKAIFAKTGLRSRRELVARLLRGAWDDPAGAA
jgi:DNA-binding CsgD family transcriptional regulator